MTDNTPDPRVRRFAAANWAIALIVAAIVAIGLILFPPGGDQATPKAQGYALTSVTNTGTLTMRLRLDNNLIVPLSPQQVKWGVAKILVQAGTCVQVANNTPVCATTTEKVITLGLNQYFARRTK
jgi:hypothetical protein